METVNTHVFMETVNTHVFMETTKQRNNETVNTSKSLS